MKLIAVDLQKALLCDELYSRDALLKNVVRLLETARSNDVEIIYVQHDAGKGSGFSQGDEGFEIDDAVKPEGEEKVFVKTINSCFGNKEFAEYLQQSGEKELMIVGLQTEFCVDATIKSAFERGYKVVVPMGTNSTFDNDYLKAADAIKYFNEWIWRGVFAECVSLEEAVQRLKKK